MIEASLRGAIREQLKSIIAAVPSATAGCPIQSKEVDQTVCNQGIFETIHLQFRDGRSTHTLRLGHPLPSPHYAIEAGLRFKIDLQRNQNIGLFLDMKPARAWLRSNCERKKVLNLFAYTCAFSVVALKGAAERVVNIDMSTSSLAWGLENHRLNQLDSRAAVFLSHEIFRSWGKIRQYAPYDIIIIDPPSFQPGSFVAEKDYPRIVKRIDDVLSRDGAVIMALNSPKLGPDFIRDLLKVHLPALSVERDFDLPDYFSESNPERELKVVLCRAKPA
jgi:23S rRNA (cytosine1962-C5)-methyltransferase